MWRRLSAKIGGGRMHREAAAATSAASAALLVRGHVTTATAAECSGNATSRCPATAAAAAAAAARPTGPEPAAVETVHDVGKTRKSAPRGPLAEGKDFAVFRRSSSWGQPAVAGADKAGAAATTLEEALEALAGDGDKGATPPSVVLLGEVHDDTVAHQLQLQVLRRCADICHSQGRRLVLSLEMFEMDVQSVLDEYVVEGAIREKDFMQDTRPWSNYVEDYRPLVEFCKAANAARMPAAGTRVIAANTPRRYVSLVSRGGFAAFERVLKEVPDNAALRERFPSLPLPPASAAYMQKFKEELASQMPVQTQGAGSCPYIGFSAQAVREVRPEMLEAQSLWDHGMASSIARALREERVGESDGEGEAGSGLPPLVLHVCGAFHCAHGLGIPEALPLYSGMAEPAETRPRASGAPREDAQPWLPIDDVAPGGANQAEEIVGPKRCPPGVLSVVLWPGSVAMTQDMVKQGRVPRGLGDMADIAIVTEELYSES